MQEILSLTENNRFRTSQPCQAPEQCAKGSAPLQLLHIGARITSADNNRGYTNMPLMDGFEFLENYKLLSPTLTDYCKIIMVSSTIDDRDIFRAKQDRSISLFAVKPIIKSVFDDILSF